MAMGHYAAEWNAPTLQENLDIIWFQFNKAYSLWPTYEEDCNEAGFDIIDCSTVHTFILSLMRNVYPYIWEQYQEDDDKYASKSALRCEITELYNSDSTNELLLTHEQCNILDYLFDITYYPAVH